ncbi:hypothetical protein LBMAG56_29510 [Verrucomicrobiota bacterium]|nr:hypothetical protein LBMAG56_29510 [Verrucomicrobiota bacterium]
MPTLRSCCASKPGRGCFQLLFALLLLLSTAPTARAHTSSLTRIHAAVVTNRLEITFELNQADLLQVVLNAGADKLRFRTPDEFAEHTRTIAQHIIAGTRVLLDGQPAPAATTADWPPERPELATKDAAGVLQPAVIPLTLNFPLPAAARVLELSFRLYDVGNFDATFALHFYRSEGGDARQFLLSRGQTARVELPATAAPGSPTNRASPNPPARETAAENPTGLLHFVAAGVEHIIPSGLDHILFVLGLFFLSPRLKPLLLQVTAFTIAHSLTLALSVFGIVKLSPAIVEPIIALSITVVAVENLFAREVKPWRWAAVFVFGLFHGLGFASLIQDAGLPASQRLPALLGFNLGVEIGQLAVVLAAFAATAWCQQRPWYFQRVTVPVSVAIAGAGIVWTIQRIFF